MSHCISLGINVNSTLTFNPRNTTLPVGRWYFLTRFVNQSNKIELHHSFISSNFSIHILPLEVLDYVARTRQR